MFVLKKIISSLVTLPGILIIFLVVSGVYGFKKKIKILQLNFFAGVIIYLLSISPVSNFLTGIIEENYSYDGRGGADVIILLGGGIIEGAADFSGTGVPSSDMLFRIIDAARLYSRYHIPVVVSGGAVGCKSRESEIAARFLKDLGVPENQIIQEGESRDTVENALYVKKIVQAKGYKKGLLVTSGYHIKRAKFIFENIGLNVIPYSSGLLSEQKECMNIFDFIPHVGNLRDSAITVREFYGIAFYYLKYQVIGSIL